MWFLPVVQDGGPDNAVIGHYWLIVRIARRPSDWLIFDSAQGELGVGIAMAIARPLYPSPLRSWIAIARPLYPLALR
jgi:hypothetical protein